MIRKDDLAELLLEATGIEPQEYTFETLGEIELPYLVYIITSETPFNADGVNYFKFYDTTLQLISDVIDNKTESLIEGFFYEQNVAFLKERSYDDEIRVYVTEYSFTTIS